MSLGIPLSSSTTWILLLSTACLIPVIQKVHAEAPDVGRKVLYAINAGSDVVTLDSHGIEYGPDPYMGSSIGVNSDYGRRFLTIGRTLSSSDAFLYQTERYGLSTFEYDIPIKTDGDYVLVLKFCEVYFLNPGRKVFSVLFNDHVIIHDLDIFAIVGHAVAHDEIIPFKVTDNGKTLLIKNEKSKISGGRVLLTFLKGSHDNPKINAFYVLRGSVEDVPQLPALDKENPYDDDLDLSMDSDGDGSSVRLEEQEETSWHEERQVRPGPRKRRARAAPAPTSHNPYDDYDPWSTIIPIGGAISVCVLTFLVVKFVVGKPTE